MEQPHHPIDRSSLKSIALFAGLPPEVLNRIKLLCRWQYFERGAPIVTRGEDTSEVYFLTEGEARVTIYSKDGHAVSFRDLAPGAVFGEYAAIDGQPRSADVEARTSCRVALISADQFRTLLQREPDLSGALVRHFVTEIRQLTERVFEFSTLCVNDRVQAEVLRLALGALHKDNVAHIGPAPKHQDIADRISTHREAVSRELKRLSLLGIVERQGNELLVREIDRLAEMVRAATGE